MAPEGHRAPWARVIVLSLLVLDLAQPAHALRIIDYNFLNFPGPSGPTREAYFRTILQPYAPDVIVAEEMTTQAGVDEVVNNILNVIEPGQWAALPFVDDFLPCANVESLEGLARKLMVDARRGA